MTKWGDSHLRLLIRQPTSTLLWARHTGVKTDREITAPNKDEPFGLGAAQRIDIPNTDLAVVHLVAQHGLKTRQGVPPIRYGALETGLHKLQIMARQRQASLHMPRLGCGLAGGQWERVEALLEKMLGELQVFVYDLNQR